MSFKKNIYNACVQMLDEKIEEFNSALSDLSAGAGNDTKSSAGDKHETSRAMMQLEYEKVGKQLQESQSQKEVLGKIDITRQSSKVITGSLIKSGKIFLFLSVPLGKISVDGETVIVLSPASPVGNKLTGLKIKDTTEMNGIKYVIDGIY